MKKPTYIIKGPHKDPTRNQFAILKGARTSDGKRTYKSVERNDLKAINTQYADKKINMIEAYRHVCDILGKLKQSDEVKFPKEAFNKDNWFYSLHGGYFSQTLIQSSIQDTKPVVFRVLESVTPLLYCLCDVVKPFGARVGQARFEVVQNFR